MIKRSPLLADAFGAAVDCAALPARLSGCFFGASASSSSNKSQQTSAPVINQPGLAMLNANGQRAQDVVANSFQPYGGLLGAPLSPNQQAASGAAPGMLNAGAPALDSAARTAAGLTGYAPPQAGATSAAPGLVGSTPQAGWQNAGLIDPNAIPSLTAGIQKYLNPYTQDVINTSMNDLNRQNAIAINQGHQNATGENAFGGDRTAVADSLTNDDYARAKASTLAGLNSSAFNAAAGLAGQDTGNAINVAGQNANIGVTNEQGQADTSRYNAGLLGNMAQFNAGNQQQTNLTNAGAANDMARFNAGNDIAGAGVRQSAANSLQNASAESQAQFGNYITSLMNTGAVDQQTVQNNLDRLYAEFQRKQQYPFQGQSLINQSEGLIPYSLGQSSQGTSSGSSFGAGFSIGGGK